MILIMFTKVDSLVYSYFYRGASIIDGYLLTFISYFLNICGYKGGKFPEPRTREQRRN